MDRMKKKIRRYTKSENFCGRIDVFEKIFEIKMYNTGAPNEFTSVPSILRGKETKTKFLHIE